MSRARPDGPLFRPSKSNLPALPGSEYLMRLAVALGRYQARREDWQDKARREKEDKRERQFCMERARDWHKLCLQQLKLMRQEYNFLTEGVK